MGFEPTRRLPAYTLSKRAPSTTRPPLLGCRPETTACTILNIGCYASEPINPFLKTFGSCKTALGCANQMGPANMLIIRVIAVMFWTVCIMAFAWDTWLFIQTGALHTKSLGKMVGGNRRVQPDAHSEFHRAVRLRRAVESGPHNHPQDAGLSRFRRARDHSELDFPEISIRIGSAPPPARVAHVGGRPHNRGMRVIGEDIRHVVFPEKS